MAARLVYVPTPKRPALVDLCTRAPPAPTRPLAVCYRPKDEVDDAHLVRVQGAFRTNGTTNHGGKKVFDRCV